VGFARLARFGLRGDSRLARELDSLIVMVVRVYTSAKFMRLRNGKRQSVTW